jgi:hypothetical protein
MDNEILWRLLLTNHCGKRNATTVSEVHVTLNNTTIMRVAKTKFLRTYVAGNKVPTHVFT